MEWLTASAGQALSSAIEMESVIAMTAVAAVSLVAWLVIISRSAVPLEAEGLADDTEDVEEAPGSVADPLLRREARVRRDQARAAARAAGGAALAVSSPLKVVKRLTVRTPAGPMRVTVSGRMPADARLTLLTVSNPGADTTACYGRFLAQAARDLKPVVNASVVSVDLPGMRSHSEEFAAEGDGGIEELPQAPALVDFSGLSDAIVDCAAAVGVCEAVGIGAHAGAWLLVSAQSRRPSLLRGLVVSGMTVGPPKSGEAATLGSLAWSLSSSGWSAWSRRLLAGSLMSTTAAASGMGKTVEAGALDWDPAWVAALLAGWSSRPLLTEEVLSSAVLGSGRYGTGRSARGGASALQSVMLLMPTVSGTGLPMCNGSPDVAEADTVSPRLNRMFGSKGLGGACSVIQTPGGPLTLSEAPTRTITPLRCVLMGFGLDV